MKYPNPMNRKKVILILAAAEMIVIAILTVLFVEGAIPMKLFIGLLVLVSLLTSAALFLAIRYLDQ